MAAGDTLRSPDGRYRFTMQSDGNGVVYDAAGRPVFASGTRLAGSTLTLQSDGNTVVYAPGRVPLWHTRTAGRPASHLTMQSDGNLVLYGTDGRATWSSRTGTIPAPATYLGSALSPGQRLDGNQGLAIAGFRALMQTDGNFVLRRDGRVVWHTGTQRNPGAFLVMQGDGNAVIYSASGLPLWTTRTGGNPGSSMRLQTDGNLVVYKPDGAPSWSRLTGTIPLPSDKGWVLQSLQIGYDFDGDFFGTARITNRNPVPMTAGWTITIFQGGRVISVMTGYGDTVAPGQTITDEMYTWDPWVPGPYTITFQVDYSFDW